MKNETVKKFDRIVSILIQLQSKRIVKAQELADRFEVSLRTIYRDIRTLEASGVPIYSEAGTGYSLMDGYRVPPVMFTQEEAASFVAAEKLMQKFTDTLMQEHFSSAMYKLRAVLKARDKDWVSNIETQVVMQPMSKRFNDEVPDALAALFESIARKTKLHIAYKALNGPEETSRTIEPVGVFHQNNFWYVIAYCYLRKDYRQFRVDRIRNIKRTDLSFELEHEPVDFYLKEKEEKPTTMVKIQVDTDVAPYLNWERNHYGFIKEELDGDKVLMTFEVRDIKIGFPRWFMMFADKAVILEPHELKVTVQELIKACMNNFQK